MWPDGPLPESQTAATRLNYQKKEIKTMFAYNPTPDRSGEILGAGQMQAAQTNAQMMGQLGSDIGGALASIGGMYAQNKGMQAEAEGYDRIGEILGGSMFKDNPAVGGFLADLRKQKNPQMKIAGYNALFGLAGPMSNAMMSQRNAGIRENQQVLTAVMPNIRAQQGAASQVAAGQGRVTTLPANINPDVIP
jgi:hypothetical protein